MTDACPYCNGTAPGKQLWSDASCRVLLIEDTPFTGLCRVVWSGHVKELSDLNEGERSHLLNVVSVVEEGLRGLLSPDKMNLAALGTQVPHLHWHVVPRYVDDTHFPEPIWAAPVRSNQRNSLSPDVPAALADFLTERLGASKTA